MAKKKVKKAVKKSKVQAKVKTNKSKNKKVQKTKIKKVTKSNVKKAKPAKKTKAVATKRAIKSKSANRQAKKPNVLKNTKASASKTNNQGTTKFERVLNLGAPFSPLGDKVLIKKAGSFEKTPGGLFIPVSAQEAKTEGKVIAVGPGSKTKKGFLKPLDVKIGDQVMYEKYAGMELKFQGESFLILAENEIIGVVS